MKKQLITIMALATILAIPGCGSDDVSVPDELVPQEEQRQVDSQKEEDKNGDDKGSNENVVYMMPETKSISLTAEQRNYVLKNNDFGLRLFRQLNGDASSAKSIVLSPIGVTYMLGMLNAGAAGDTSTEICSLLGFGEGGKADVNEFCHAVATQAPLADPSVMLETANMIAFRNGLTPESLFADDMRDYYDAQTVCLDFGDPTTADYINRWCSETTHGMICKMVDGIDPKMMMMMLDAVYFKATWTDKFDPADTREEPFKLVDGTEKALPTMHRKAMAAFADNDTYSALCLPYGSGDKWAMTALLPHEGKSVADVLAELNVASWTGSWWRRMEACLVDVKIPRFTTESDTSLNEPISQLGAPTMFMPDKADFSGIATSGVPLYVGLMKQKAAIEVNEEGTKATAVTMAGMVSSAGPLTEKVFHADHPFVYFIQEASSGIMFFIGVFAG